MEEHLTGAIVYEIENNDHVQNCIADSIDINEAVSDCLSTSDCVTEDELQDSVRQELRNLLEDVRITLY